MVIVNFACNERELTRVVVHGTLKRDFFFLLPP